MENKLFTILDSIESTNNYAMAKAHAGLATNGEAWFANEQWGGRGQRGKQWIADKGQNIILTITIKPDKAFATKPFYFNAYIATTCRHFLAKHLPQKVCLKWPNDIYINDNKAGGILIENVYQGKQWKWAVVGIGININQLTFEPNIKNPTSLKKHTNITYHPVELALQLYEQIMQGITDLEVSNVQTCLADFNKYLYKQGEIVTLKAAGKTFKTTILGVNEYGQLVTNNGIEEHYNFGEIEWVL